MQCWCQSKNCCAIYWSGTQARQPDIRQSVGARAKIAAQFIGLAHKISEEHVHAVVQRRLGDRIQRIFDRVAGDDAQVTVGMQLLAGAA